MRSERQETVGPPALSPSPANRITSCRRLVPRDCSTSDSPRACARGAVSSAGFRVIPQLGKIAPTWREHRRVGASFL